MYALGLPSKERPVIECHSMSPQEYPLIPGHPFFTVKNHWKFGKLWWKPDTNWLNWTTFWRRVESGKCLWKTLTERAAIKRSKAVPSNVPLPQEYFSSPCSRKSLFPTVASPPVNCLLWDISIILLSFDWPKDDPYVCRSTNTLGDGYRSLKELENQRTSCGLDHCHHCPLQTSVVCTSWGNRTNSRLIPLCRQSWGTALSPDKLGTLHYSGQITRSP